jgi:hypothetical protein
MVMVVKKWWTLNNELGHWLNVGMFGDVLVICQGSITKLLRVVTMGDVWKLVFHHFIMLWLRVVLRKPNGEVGNKRFWASYHLGFFRDLKKMDVHVCCTMWLNFWGGCLMQLGKKDIICLNQTPNDLWCSNREFHEGSNPPPPQLLIYLGLHV